MKHIKLYESNTTKKYKVILCSCGEDLFSAPEPHKTIYVESDSIDKVYAFAEKEKDEWGFKYKINPNKGDKSASGRFDLLSKNGGVIIEEYNPIEPKFITLF